MVHDKKEKSKISEATSSDLGITTARQWNLIPRCVACLSGFTWRTNHHVLFSMASRKLFMVVAAASREWAFTGERKKERLKLTSWR